MSERILPSALEPAAAAEAVSNSQDDTPRLLSAPFVRLLIAQACFGYAFSSFFLLPKYLASELGASASSIGLLHSANTGFAVVFMFSMGVMVDRYGRRRFLTAGSLIMTAASLGFVAVDSIGPLIYFLRVVQALAFSMAFVAGAALTVDLADPRRLGQAIGLFGLTMLSMNAVAPAVVEEVAQSYGWSLAFMTAAGGSLAAAVLSRRIEDRAHSPNPDAGFARLLEVAREPAQIRAAVVVALVGACFGSLFVFHQVYALELGIPDVRIFFVTYAIAAIFSRLVLGGLGDRLGRLRVSAAALLLYGLGALGMMELARIGLAPLGALFGLAHGIFYPTYNAAVVEEGDEADRGTIVALVQGWFNAGMAIGVYLLGVLADARGYPIIFAVSAAAMGLAFVVVAASAVRGHTTR
jgi:predicted MFS family arabinose efflux permease